MFVVVFSLLALQCVIALPVDEQEPIEYREWVPPRAAYARDFENWFDWVPWSSEGKRTPSIKERIQILENRQNVLFDLVRCESYRRSDCAPFRTQAETLFEVPSRQEDPTEPTKILTTPADNQASSAMSTARESRTSENSAAPIENDVTEVQSENSVEASMADTTQ